MLPVDDVDCGAAAETPPVPANRDLRDHPIAGSPRFDSQIHDNSVDAVKFGQLRIVHLNPRIEDLGEYQDFAGTLGEASDTHVAGGEGDRARFDRSHAQHGDEYSFAREHFDHQAEYPWLLAADADRDDNITHSPDRFTVRTEDNQAGEPGCKYLACCCHDCKANSLRVIFCNRDTSTAHELWITTPKGTSR